MADTPVARQIEAVFDLVDKGMAILRDDRAMDFSDPAFGEPHSINGGIKDQGKEYVYRTEKLPGVDIVFATVADPFDYSDDRAKVAVVPRFFELNFISSSVRIDINPSLIKQRLSLSDYWVDSGGARNPGNDLGAGIPPTPLLHAYRYRASETADSRFPVNVELAYGDADPNDQTTRCLLMAITISRDYPYLTPEMRRQKREEQKALPWHALPERSADQ